MAKRKKYIKERTSDSNSPGIELQVIGTGAADQPAIVALNAVEKCYLFNCGEGIGRHCQELKISLKRVSNIFFTQSKWQCIGGVTSVNFVTIATRGYPPKIHGPENLQKIIQRTVFLSSVGSLFEHRFKGDSFFTTERFEDNKIIVEPIQLNYGHETAMLYVCKLIARRGGFSLQKSVDKNVPAAMLQKLFNGESITLDDGTIVKPTDVRYPDMPEVNLICKLNSMIVVNVRIFNCFFLFQISIVIDVPSPGFLTELQNNEKFKNLLEDAKPTGIELIVHFTPDKVFQSKDYQHFIDSIGAKRQLVVNDSNK